MRLLGVARVVRAVLRRWVGGIFEVDDVHFALRSGALELVNVELSLRATEALLKRLGLRGARIASARVARIAVSLPMSWRRGARVRLRVERATAAVDARGEGCREESAEDARARTIAAMVEEEEEEDEKRVEKTRKMKAQTTSHNTPERYWRRVARRVAESVDIEIAGARGTVELPLGALWTGTLESATIEADFGAAAASGWAKTLEIKNLRAEHSSPGAGEQHGKNDLTMLEPCDLSARVRLSTTADGSAALDAAVETVSRWKCSLSAARLAALVEALATDRSLLLGHNNHKKDAQQQQKKKTDVSDAVSRDDDASRRRRLAALQELFGGGGGTTTEKRRTWRYCLCLAKPSSRSAKAFLFRANLDARRRYLGLCRRRFQARGPLSQSSSETTTRFFFFPIRRSVMTNVVATTTFDDMDRELRQLEKLFRLEALVLMRRAAAGKAVAPKKEAQEEGELAPLSEDSGAVVETKAREALAAPMARVRIAARVAFDAVLRGASDEPMARVRSTLATRFLGIVDDDDEAQIALRATADGRAVRFDDLAPASTPQAAYAATPVTDVDVDDLGDANNGDDNDNDFFDDDLKKDDWADFAFPETFEKTKKKTTTTPRRLLVGRSGTTKASPAEEEKVCVCWIPRVGLVFERGLQGHMAATMHLRGLDVVAAWPLISHGRAAADALLRAFSRRRLSMIKDATTAGENSPSPEKTYPQKKRRETTLAIDIREARVALPYDWTRDRGAMIVNYDRAQLSVPAEGKAQGHGATFRDLFFGAPPANPPAFPAIDLEADFEELLADGPATIAIDNWRVTEVAPAAPDDPRPLVTASTVRGTAAVSRVSPRLPLRRVSVGVDINDDLVDVVTSGRRLARVLAILDTYLRFPVAAAVAPEWNNNHSSGDETARHLYSSSSRDLDNNDDDEPASPRVIMPAPNNTRPRHVGVLIDVRVFIPKVRVVVLPPVVSKLFKEVPGGTTSLVPGELVATISNLVVCSRQREEPCGPFDRFGFRAQRYSFQDARVDLVSREEQQQQQQPEDDQESPRASESFYQEKTLARLVESCSKGGAFEYSVSWPPYQPSAAAAASGSVTTDAAPRALRPDASLKRLVVDGPRARCAPAEIARALDAVISLLDGFTPSTRWDHDDPSSTFLVRNLSRSFALFETAFRRLEYVVSDYDVVLVSRRRNRRPLALLRGKTARYLVDDDGTSFLERFALADGFRVDAYRVATACWEPLLEPGAEFRFRTAKDLRTGDERGDLDSLRSLDLVLSRDAAAVLRALALDALDLVALSRKQQGDAAPVLSKKEEEEAHHAHKKKKKKKQQTGPPPIAAAAKTTTPTQLPLAYRGLSQREARATLTNLTGCAVWLELFDEDGDALSFFHVPQGATNVALPDAACDALFVAADDANDATTIWRASRPLPLRRAAAVVAPTLRTDILFDQRRRFQKDKPKAQPSPVASHKKDNWFQEDLFRVLVGERLSETLSETLAGSSAAGLVAALFDGDPNPPARRRVVRPEPRRLSENDTSDASDESNDDDDDGLRRQGSSSSSSPRDDDADPRQRRRRSARTKLSRHARAATEELLQTHDVARSAPIVWKTAFDERGVLRVECRAALRARNESGRDVTLAASATAKMVARRGTPDAPKITPLPLAFAARVFDMTLEDADHQEGTTTSSRRSIVVGDGDQGESVATLDLDSADSASWQVASLGRRRDARVRARLEPDDDEIGAVADEIGISEAADASRPVVVCLTAEIVFRNALPLPVEFCVLALQRASAHDDDFDMSDDEDDEDEEEHDDDALDDDAFGEIVAKRRPLDFAGAAQTTKRHFSIPRPKKTYGRAERVVVCRGVVAPGASAAVVEADAHEYVWIASRCRVPESSRRQCAWAVAKLNAKSWRRRVAAARALRQRQPVRTKAMDADARFGFSVDDEARDEMTDRKAAHPRSKDSKARGYSLEVTARTPCVVIDRTGLGVAVGRSRLDVRVFHDAARKSHLGQIQKAGRLRSSGQSAGVRRQLSEISPPASDDDDDECAWCPVRASSLSAAPKAYRAVPASLRRFCVDSDWFLSAFDDKAASKAPFEGEARAWVASIFPGNELERRRRRERSDAKRHATLVWDMSRGGLDNDDDDGDYSDSSLQAAAYAADDPTDDVSFLGDPSTLAVTTSGADATSKTKRGASSWLLRIEPKKECVIIVAFDARAERRPIWLAEGGFVRRPSMHGRRCARLYAVDGDRLTSRARGPRHRFDLYEKTCRPDEVVALGPSRSRGDPKPRANLFMYAVFVQPKKQVPARRWAPISSMSRFPVGVDDFSDDDLKSHGFSDADARDEMLSPTRDNLDEYTDDDSDGHPPKTEEKNADEFFEAVPSQSPNEDESGDAGGDIAKSSSPPAAENKSKEEEDDDEFFDCRETGATPAVKDDDDDDDDDDDEQEEVRPLRKSLPYSAKALLSDKGDFLSRLAFVSSDARLAVSALRSTRVELVGEPSTSDSESEADFRLDKKTAVHEMRLATAAASGEPHPFELAVRGGIAALCAAVTSAPAFAGRAGRVVTLLPRYVVANASQVYAIELSQPDLPTASSVRSSRGHSPADEYLLGDDDDDEPLRDSPALKGPSFLTPVLRLEPGESAALHWASSEAPRIAKIRAVPPLNAATVVPSDWSRGALHLERLGSQTVALRPQLVDPVADDARRQRRIRRRRFSDMGAADDHDFDVAAAKATTPRSRVLRLSEATVFRIEARARAGDDDDFATLVTVGDATAPVVSCSNETDVLVACWQLPDDDEEEHSTARAAEKAPLSRASSREDLKAIPEDDDRFDKKKNKKKTRARRRKEGREVDPFALGQTRKAQRWLVRPRSEDAFGWCFPRGSHTIAAVALANRSEADAAILLSGAGGDALDAVAARLAVDQVGARFLLPMIEHSGESDAQPVVWTQDWGIEAVIDTRAGANVVRFVRHGKASFSDVLSQRLLVSSRPPPGKQTGDDDTFTMAKGQIDDDDDEDDIFALSRPPPLNGSDDASQTTPSMGQDTAMSFFHSLSQYVARCKSFSASIVLDDLDDASSSSFRTKAGDPSSSAHTAPRARRETLRLAAERCELVLRLASSGHTSSKAASTLDCSIGDFRVESYARDRHFDVVVERDRDSATNRADDINPPKREVAVHVSVVRQRDGNADVWRYAGARIAPLAVALDRPMLCALCATVDAMWPPVDRRATSGLGFAADDVNDDLERRRCRNWARDVRSLALAPPTPPRAAATIARIKRPSNIGGKDLGSDVDFDTGAAGSIAEEESDDDCFLSDGNGRHPQLLPAAQQETRSPRETAEMRRRRRRRRRRMLRMARADDPRAPGPLDFSDDGEDSQDDTRGTSLLPSARRFDLPASMLFEAFAAEPRAYVDTMEISTLRLRVTLALAARAGNDLARATLLRGGALSSSSAALLEIFAPLASLSDTTFRLSEFAVRHALLTIAQLRAALVKHARREALRAALAAIGLSYASPRADLDPFQRRRRRRRKKSRARDDDDIDDDDGAFDEFFDDDDSEVGALLATPARSEDGSASAMDKSDDAWFDGEGTPMTLPAPNEEPRREASSCFFPWRRQQLRPTSSGSSLQSLRNARQEGAQELLSADAAYFGKQARRKSLSRAQAPLRQSVVPPPLMRMMPLRAEALAALTQQSGDDGTQDRLRLFTQSLEEEEKPREIRRRRALAALPDGGGARRRLEPYSKVGAAAQALARALFQSKRFEDDDDDDDDDNGERRPSYAPTRESCEAPFSLCGLRANARRRSRELQVGDDPSSRDGEPYVDHTTLADGGLVVFCSRGIVVLNKRHRRWPWAALWKSLRVAKDGDETFLLTRTAGAAARYGLGQNMARVELASAMEAKVMREKLRLLGVTVERYVTRAAALSSLDESTPTVDPALSAVDDDDDDLGVDWRRHATFGDRPSDAALADWAEAAVDVAIEAAKGDRSGRPACVSCSIS